MSTKVFIYWNLHKKCWSVRDERTRRVIEHRQCLTLRDCTFKVSEAGRQRVLREKRKNVHAGVVGYLTDDYQDCNVAVYYNPYLQSTFTVHGAPIYNASIVTFYPDKKVLTKL